MKNPDLRTAVRRPLARPEYPYGALRVVGSVRNEPGSTSTATRAGARLAHGSCVWETHCREPSGAGTPTRLHIHQFACMRRLPSSRAPTRTRAARCRVTAWKVQPTQPDGCDLVTRPERTWNYVRTDNPHVGVVVAYPGRRYDELQRPPCSRDHDRRGTLLAQVTSISVSAQRSRVARASDLCGGGVTTRRPLRNAGPHTDSSISR